jgi:hypothetical protein
MKVKIIAHNRSVKTSLTIRMLCTIILIFCVAYDIEGGFCEQNDD